MAEQQAVMTPASVESFLQSESARGVTENTLRRYRNTLRSLQESLPPSGILTKEHLQAWREGLQTDGLSPATVQNYVKYANRYLDHAGFSRLRFSRGNPKDLTGQSFGSLAVLSPTGEKKRTDCLWLCRCACGTTVTVPATLLLRGKTKSCGCLKTASIRDANQYVAHTNLRQTLDDTVKSTRSASGCVGVSPKRGKWQAYITYKGVRYSLGCYELLADAVKARAVAKERVMEEALALLQP